MTKKEIQAYLHDPEIIDIKATENLSALIDRFPYTSILRMIRLKGLQLSDDVSYENELKTTAIHTGDRNMLYDLMKPKKERELSPELQISPELKKTKKPIEFRTTPLDEANFEKELEAEAGKYSLDVSDEIPKLDEILKKVGPKVVVDDEKKMATPTRKGLPSNLIDFITGKSSEDELENYDEKAELKIKEPKDKRLKDFEESKKKALKGIKPIFSPEKMAKLSLLEDKNLVTETLAKIFVKQKNYKKAKKAYKYLSLKYPEKSIYFAGQIKKVKELETEEKGKKGKEETKKRKIKSRKQKEKEKKEPEKKKNKSKSKISAKKKSGKKNTKKNKKK